MHVHTMAEIKAAAHLSLSICSPTWPKTLFQSRINDFLSHAIPKLAMTDGYKHFSNTAYEIEAVIEKEYGASGRKAFMRLLLLNSVIELVDGERLKKLPPTVLKYQLADLLRIASDSSSNSDWLRLSSDLFHKEFGLATLRLFSAGPQVIDVRAGVPRSLLFRQGWFDFLYLFFKFGRLGGFKPYFQIHLHKFNADQFNEFGREECYRCCVELYDLFPEVLGMFGASWFYDPALDKISPKLAYLRKTPQGGGAFLMYCSSGEDAKINALANSRTRKALVESGSYTPKNYMLVWGRKDQVKWATKS